MREESTAGELHCFTSAVEDRTGVDDIIAAVVVDELICVRFTLREKISSVVELIMCKLGEVGECHDWQPVVGDIPGEFRVTKQKDASF